MDFAQLLDAVRTHPQAVTIPAHWGQGRAVYGGLMAALLYQAMASHVQVPLRTLALTFVGPVAPEVPVSIEVEVLRQGKSVTSLLARARQGGATLTVAQASFGAPRQSMVAVTAMPVAAMKPLAECIPIDYIEGVTPAYIRQLAMRWGIGALPFSATPSLAIGGWMRVREPQPAQPLDEAYLLLLADVWPPAVLPHLAAPAAGSTLSWTIELVQPMPALTTAQWLRYRAQIEHARDGYGHTAAAIWSEAGELVAISRQTVTVFG
ncbi:acyl-CoA thioesterase [Pseudomonas typographi]|uniref:Thioesterase family protein n=1 Tax=Pseudomonas typographi TaxID=2715964 RepID=A0ABR7Z0Q9_9PSED|nr:thioesterase family protein [Pseudomonas typographi]MBD1588715.1 thioesterase family protein [Pseudomonas typographi]MBD1599055.1 thioesterase family protein [Pseudomonas typographi]